MITADINRLLTKVSTAAEAVRSSLASRIEPPEILDCFWWLQDYLGQLVEVVSDQADEALPILRQQYSQLMKQIVEILDTVRSFKIGRIPAVVRSCEIISRSLQQIEHLDQRTAAVALN